jgi:predicted alpha/beta superfamily hydrolase
VTIDTHFIKSTIATTPGRNIRVWLPPGYSDSGVPYPVMYLHDGQNCFAPGGPYGCWNAEINAAREVEAGRVPPFIMVAIDNDGDNRRYEYVPPEDRIKDYPAGRGDAYGRFVVENVMPEINRSYRTLTGPEHTALVGSSLGGVISLYMAFETGVFGRIGSMSTAIFWAPNYLAKLMVRGPSPLRIYHDIGTREAISMAPANYWEVNQTLDRVLRKITPEVHFVIGEGDDHNEPAWDKRFPAMIRWLWDNGPRK